METLSFQGCDPDFRRKPKTDYYCLLCHRDINEEKPHRIIHVISGGDQILHPDRYAEYQPDAGDCGAHPIGNDCAKRIGIEWSIPSEARSAQ